MNEQNNRNKGGIYTFIHFILHLSVAVALPLFVASLGSSPQLFFASA